MKGKFNKKEDVATENAMKVAGKNFDPSNYDSDDEVEKALAITHEQVSDVFTEGTSDGKIDELNEKDELKTHDGKKLRRQGYEK